INAQIAAPLRLSKIAPPKTVDRGSGLGARWLPLRQRRGSKFHGSDREGRQTVKYPTLVRTGILAMALAGSAAARADVITLDVTGSMSPSVPGASCAAAGCTLGGDIVINNSTGAIVSEDVTATGFLPSVGPFTVNSAVVGIGGGLIDVRIANSAN